MPWEQNRRPGRRAFPQPIARAILERDQQCMVNLTDHCTGNAEIADHVTGWADATAAGWDPDDIDHPDNGQAVCTPCHTVKTQAEAARGRARTAPRRSRQRQREQHPGLT